MKEAKVKSVDGVARIGLSIPVHAHERLGQVLSLVNMEIGYKERVTQSYLFEAVVSTMSKDEIVLRLRGLHKLEEVIHRKASADLLGMVRGKSAEQIRQMAAAADNGEAERSEG